MQPTQDLRQAQTDLCAIGHIELVEICEINHNIHPLIGVINICFRVFLNLCE